MELGLNELDMEHSKTVEGYFAKKDKRGLLSPDPEWWGTQIQAGERYRKEKGHDDRWFDWREMYRNNFAPGMFPKNIMFAMRRTLVPRIYFRTPSVSITSKKPGMFNILLAKVMERLDNQLLERMNVKEEMKRMVDTCFITGTAIGKLGYGAQYTPTPEGGITEAPIGKDGEKVEYKTNVRDSQPWFSWVDPAKFIVAWGSISLDDSFFYAEQHDRPWFDLKNDERFKDKLKHEPDPSGTNDPNFYDEEHPRATVKIYEIRDRRTGLVFIYAPTLQTKILLNEEDEFQRNGLTNYFDLVFNRDDECFWAVSDAKILEPYQLELNEIKTQMMKIRRQNIPKLLSGKDGISEDEAEKLFSEDVGAVVYANDIREVTHFEVSPFPEALARQEQQIMQDVQEIMGFSRNAFGQFAAGSSDKTATEVQAVKAASEIRVDERRDKMADVLKYMTVAMNQLLNRFWTTEQVVDVVGPEGEQVWVKFTSEELKSGSYNVGVDADSSQPVTKATRKEEAFRVFELMRQEDPNVINPMGLRKKVLRELGVEYEALLVNPQGPATGEPVSMGQLQGQFENKGAQTGIASQPGSTAGSPLEG